MPHIARGVRFHPWVVTDVVHLPSLSQELKTAQFYTADEIDRFHKVWRNFAMKEKLCMQLKKQQEAAAKAQVTRVLTTQLQSALPLVKPQLCNSSTPTPVPVSPVSSPKRELTDHPITPHQDHRSAFRPYSGARMPTMPPSAKQLYISAKIANIRGLHDVENEHLLPRMPILSDRYIKEARSFSRLHFPSIPNKRSQPSIHSAWGEPPQMKMRRLFK